MNARLLAALVSSLMTAPLLAAEPSNCRLYLVGQYNWGEKTGFYLDLEGPELSSLPLILGVADGKDWRFNSVTPKFETEREYRIKAVVGSDRSELWLDGERVIEMAAAWQPSSQPLVVNDKPGWANDPGEWMCVPSRISVTLERAGDRRSHADFDFSEWAALPAPLHFFQGGYPESMELQTQPGDTLTVEISLRFGGNELRRYAPYIDRFGQAIAADFPGKVTDEAELVADIASEDAELAKLPPSPDFDQYGGYRLAWREQATGFFRVVLRDGKWWLITPDGNPCFFTGVCGPPQQTWETTPITGREHLYAWLPPHEGSFAGAWSRNQWGVQDGTEYCCLYSVNLMRKYGDDWMQRATERCLRRLRAFGMQGGKWGCGVPLAETPVLHHREAPSLAGHPDIFDPAVCDRLRDSLTNQIAPRLQDPRVVGWSYGNEYDEIIKRDEVKEILEMGADVPARRALIEYALKRIYGGDLGRLAQAWQVQARDPEALHATQPQVPDADIERMRLHYEGRYHEFVYKTIKAADPNHLYLGFWIVPGWWESPEDWAATVPYCDIIGYDRYTPKFADERLLKLFASADKPVLCGEFSHPAFYGGRRGFGRYGNWSKDEAHAGEMYRDWMSDAARNPYCVGLIWFLYRDQPLTGRGPGRGDQLVIGEHYAFGLVTEQDRVKWPLVRAMREANYMAPLWRLGKEQ